LFGRYAAPWRRKVSKQVQAADSMAEV